MDRHKLSVFMLLVFLQYAVGTQQVDKMSRGAPSSNCTVSLGHLTTQNEEVYLGWPHSISCEDLQESLTNEWYANLDPDDYNYDETIYATCVIWDLDRNEMILNKTGDFNDFAFSNHNIVNMMENTSRNYQIEASLSGSTSCYSYRLHLNATRLPDINCQQSTNVVAAANRSHAVDVSTLMRCQVPNSVKPKIVHHLLPPNYTITWYRNCEILPETSPVHDINRDELRIWNVTYNHPGLYSCALTHNGMTRFVTSYRFCVKPAKTKANNSLTCTKHMYHTSVGDTAVLECLVGLGSAELSSIHYTAIWSRGAENICVNPVKGESASEQDPRIKCSYQTTEYCFHEVPSPEEQQQTSKVIVLQLIIENVDYSDFGEYGVIFKTTVDVGSAVSQRVELVQENVPLLWKNIVVIAVCVGFLIFVFVFAAFIWWKLLYVKVYYKRQFGSYALDDKKYGAFFSYHFSCEMDKFAQQQTRDVVSMVREELESLGYKIYDEHKDGYDVALRAESALGYMKQSHRVVVLLTSEYLKDLWSVFTVQKGFEEMVKFESKLIFILVPGIKEYIKQHSATDDTCRMILRAIKTNYAIECSNKSNFNSKDFSMRLEYAMPKLRSQAVSRHTSTSSSVLSQNVQYKNGFRRTVSNETGSTYLNSPVATGDQFVEFVTENTSCKQNPAL